jgi:hypothetical protein
MASFPLPPGEPALYPNSDAGFTAPDLSDWQFEYNSLMFGPSTDLGILKIDGMGALPTVGSQDVAFPRDTGEWQGVDAMAGRDPIIDVWTSTDIYAQFSNVGAACAVNPYSVLPLWFQLPSFEILCSMCRPRNRTSTWDADTAAAGEWAPTLTWHANDPRLYGQGQVANAPESDSTSTSWSVDNAGNCEMRPVLVLTGPLPGPSIFNESISGSPGIVFQPGTAVNEGDQVVVDLDPLHLVTYYVGGIASPSARVPVYNWLNFLDTTWWNLLVGTNDLTGTVASGPIDADQFSIWWSSAYML